MTNLELKNRVGTPVELTNQERHLIDSASKLTSEELAFLMDVLQIVEATPEKSGARAAFMKDQADSYSFGTTAGREAILDALRSL